ncbi:MAG: ribosome biogenesis GTPase Der [Verrucomicrobiota bacterium]
MSANFTVAIVGRPNVGKSRLFNRIIGERVSIVHDMPGVTRDIVSRDYEGIHLMDTGGMGLRPGMSDTPEKLVGAVEGQVHFSIDTSDYILFVVDGREGMTPLDKEMAMILRQSGKPVALVINKVDQDDLVGSANQFHKLGFSDHQFMVSAEHNRGMSELKKDIFRKRDEVAGPPEEEEDDGSRVIRVCFIGRPNVGKSSLSNRLVQSDRFIVSDVPGTTRDSVEMPFEWESKRGEKWKFILTDTAGIRKKTKLNSSVEYFSRIRSLDSIKDVDIVFMVIDAAEGPTLQDKAIAGEAAKLNKPIVIVVNKWDLALKAWENDEIDGFETEKDFRIAFEKGLHREIFFTPGSPVRFVSALENYEIEKMLFEARRLDKRLNKKISTGRLNNMLGKLTRRMPAPKSDGKRFRIFYAVHVSNRPYRLKMFCNDSKKLKDSYKRFVQKELTEEFGLEGCPLVFNLVNKKNPYVADED